MANGQQLSQLNFETFLSWTASKTDDDFRALEIRGVLSRKEVAKECGFSKSSLEQNPRIKATLHELEDGLRLRGVLPLIVERSPDKAHSPLRDTGHLSTTQDVERLRRLEQENAGLKAELAELKRTVEKFAVLRDALAMTGRLPR